jgi:glycosyltransferase involved in cell wall biosynthesis
VFQYLTRLEALGIQPVVLIVRAEHSTVQLLTAARQGRAHRAAHLAVAWLENHRAMAQVVRRVRDFDRVFIYRCPVPAWARPALLAHRDRILFDFDDALDQPELEGGPLQHWRVRVLRQGMQNAVAVSRLTITSNRRNAAVVRELGGQVEIIPTSVDVSRAVLRDRTRLSTLAPILGWIGTPTTARYLGQTEDALIRLSVTRPLDVRLIGAGRNPFGRFQPDLRPWSLESEFEDVDAFDIGLMPMADTQWTRGKAALKALQYGAAGMPTVASWTETNAEILGEREGALLCRSTDEWLGALERLLDNDEFRVELGARARRRVEAGYSLDAMAPRLYRAIADPGGQALNAVRPPAV